MSGAPRGLRDLMRWHRERLRKPRAPLPSPDQLPRVQPDMARPRAAADEIRITWVGHATFLLQAGGLNLLTDPMFGERASPVRWIGPRRLVPPGVPFDDLPPIDAVVLSHDHYDHLDAPTVQRLVARFGSGLRWITPRGYARWLQRRGARTVSELDWWETAGLDAPQRAVRVTACPARHWTRRSPFDEPHRHWASFAIDAGPGRNLYFAGDSGYFEGFARIGARFGPFAAALLPIGAYEPRWFMRDSHMNPAEAVRAWSDLGGSGHLVAMHWGTFVLTDEPVLEPPSRVRQAWANGQREAGNLSILRHGETLIMRREDSDR